MYMTMSRQRASTHDQLRDRVRGHRRTRTFPWSQAAALVERWTLDHRLNELGVVGWQTVAFGSRPCGGYQYHISLLSVRPLKQTAI